MEFGTLLEHIRAYCIILFKICRNGKSKDGLYQCSKFFYHVYRVNCKLEQLKIDLLQI